MGDITAAKSAAPDKRLDNARKELKFALSNGRCDIATALNNGIYDKELLEMRAAIKKHGGSLNEADGATVLKFLLDCSLKPEKAAKRLVQCQKWRASYLPLGHVPESEVSDLLAAETIGMAGKSIHGWPVVVVFACKDTSARRDHEVVKRFIVYILDKAMACGAQNGRMIAIVDVKSAGWKAFDLNDFVTSLQLQQKYYPGILGKVYMVNAPKLVIKAWKLASPVISQSTKEKIVFLESHEIPDALLSDMGADVVPKEYGGRGEIVWLQNVRVPNLGSATG